MTVLSSIPLDDLIEQMKPRWAGDFVIAEEGRDEIRRRFAALEADLGDALTECEKWSGSEAARMAELDAAESENARLLAALTEIAEYECFSCHDGPCFSDVRLIARAALSEGGKDA